MTRQSEDQSYGDLVLTDAEFPSTRYQGSKRQLIDWLWTQISTVTFSSMLDAFGGTGAVSYRAKKHNALDEFDWPESRGDPQPVTETQLRELWNALDNLDECPVRGYELPEWRLWMKILIVFLIAVGPRSKEVERLDVRRQLSFGDDPYVRFDRRKNLPPNKGPVKVPIMFGAAYLEAYVDYIQQTNQNGKLIPSPQSESGSRTPGTLNNWLESLCKRADVRLDDGSFPTMQNFRQFWRTRYKKALHENRKQIQIVSQEGKTQNPDVDEENYIGDDANRQHIRELARRHFDGVLDLGELPELLQTTLEQNQYLDRQTTISDFSSPA